MNINKIEEDFKKLIEIVKEESFIYDFLKLYDIPQASITRLLKGDFNLSKNPGEILWKKKLCFKIDKTEDLHELIDSLSSDKNITKHHPRFIIVTDFDEFLAVDTKNSDSLDVPFKELYKHYDFFLPWAGLEKSQLHSENPADIKAAEKMGKLYDLILQDNKVSNEADRHALNVFLSRLLFCFFAEDTGIFKDDQFTNAIASHTIEDGSDLQAYLQRLFLVLNTQDTTNFPKYLQEFPYVNGGLFAHDLPVPTFSAKARKIILECGELNWKAINPDIFGSMIQAVIHEDMRGGLGMHYTSVTNIMKVIEPLFLNELYEQFEKAGDSKTKLKALLDRIYNLKIFDPACGSGNFLIITYKELCKLEIKIFKKLYGGQMAICRYHGQIKLTQFYGIELDDFAHETARLSLWLAEHQMNITFKEIFGDTKPTLPLQDGGNIVCGNATRLDWNSVCPNIGSDEVYVIGNPPYLGGKVQSKDQKNDMSIVFNFTKKYGELDYIACWFMKAAFYIKQYGRFAFVTTSSICQGAQVHQLWPLIYKQNLEIKFAYKPFKWSNNAKSNAQIICSIIGVSRKSNESKMLYHDRSFKEVNNINAYLIPGNTIIVHQELTPISDLPKILTGNSPYDGGNLLLTTKQKEDIVSVYPDASMLIKKIHGAKDYINGNERWCLWITDDKLNLAMSIPPIKERIEHTKLSRMNGGEVAKCLVDRPHQFRYTHSAKKSLLIIPRVSSMRRKYIPFGFLDSNNIVSDSAQAIYDPEPYVFAVISSMMHMAWVNVLAGRLKTDYRYSSALCYNTFPFPRISEKQKYELEEHVFNILDIRERNSEKTLAQLYNPDQMPSELVTAHQEMDFAVEKCYRNKPFSNDEERIDYLLNFYEEMINA